MRHSSAPSTVRPKVRKVVPATPKIVRPLALAFPVAECVGADHPHSADLYDGPTLALFEAGPTEVDYRDYRDVLEGVDDVPSDEDWADYGQWIDGVRADRQERDYHPAELDEMRIRHGVIDCYA